MHILIVSWRDIKNPNAGGAEVLTHEVCKRAVKKGNRITLLAPLFPDAKPRETVDGVNIIRPAYFFPKTIFGYFYWFLFMFSVIRTYLQQLKHKIDVVVDQVHGLPWFTPLYVKQPVIFFPHEVAADIWFSEFPFPANTIGWLLERTFLFTFRHFPFFSNSLSTKNALMKNGVVSIYMLNPGTSPPPELLSKKTAHPTFIVLGRITKMKRIKDSLQAMTSVKKKYPKIKIHIVGKGDQALINELHTLSEKLGLQTSVCFHGFVSQKRKYELLSQSWALVSTSLREGWGLNVIEAASVATPTVAYRVPGIVDTVIDGRTGLLTKANNPQNLEKKLIFFIEKHELRTRLEKQALLHAGNFTWEKTTEDFLSALKTVIDNPTYV